MIIIMVGIVTRRVRMDMTIIIRIFNRMFMMVSILNRIIINIKWMAIRMSINGQDKLSLCSFGKSANIVDMIDKQGLADLGCFAFLFLYKKETKSTP